VIIADGLKGHDGVSVKIKGHHYKEVKIASALYHADALLVTSHFKGHSVAGFGGAIKNLGMGGGTRSSKQLMHSDVKPWVNEKTCIACGRCINWCPVKAIKIEAHTKKAAIDPTVCYGCGECLITCPTGAIAITWKESSERVQEKMAEFALGVFQSQKGRIAFVNFVIRVSPDCDCWNFSEPPVVEDLGILASLDPVAIDQAGLDLVTQAPGLKGHEPGQNKFAALYPEVPLGVQLECGEKLGLGSREYQLIPILD
jgi:uncharacterized protein